MKKAKCSGHADSVMETIGMMNVRGTQLLRLESRNKGKLFYLLETGTQNK